MAPSLSPRPDLKQLKRQAKELLKAQQAGDQSVCAKLRLVPRLSSMTDEEILSVDVGLQEAQHALAKHYGFRTWAQLKHHVEAQSVAQEADGPSSYVFAAVNPSGQTIRGNVEAKDPDEAVARIRTQGNCVIALASAETANEETIELSADQAVELVLLQSVRTGESEVQFDFSEKRAAFWLSIGRESSPRLPFPAEITSAQLLAKLRDMSGSDRLGDDTGPVRRSLKLGTGLAGGHLQPAELEFFSKEPTPGDVYVRPCLPRPPGTRRARRSEIVREIAVLCRDVGTVHVLTDAAARAEKLAVALRQTLGEPVVSIMERSRSAVPENPIVVSVVTEMCFTYLKARMAGAQETAAAEERLEKTAAVCVNVSPELGRTPCEIHGPNDVALASMRVAPFLNYYASVREFEEET